MCIRKNIFIFVIAAIAMPAYAGTPLFGPKKFVRTAGKPNVYNETFNVGDTTQPCTLKVFNGENGQNRISSASIMLNGVEVVKENEFNQQVDSIVKPVQCRGSNRMTVTLLSAPQGFITVGVYGKASGVQLVWEKELPTGAINKGIGYGFVEEAPGILLWVYRDDLKAIQYLDSLGNLVYEHIITEPGKNTTFAGISKNGKYFAKASYLTSENHKYDNYSYLTVIRYDGQIMWTADSAYQYNFISNDGTKTFNWWVGSLGAEGSKVLVNGRCTNILDEYVFYESGDVDENLTIYAITGIDTIYSFNNQGNIAWKIPIPGRYRWPGWNGKTIFCSPDGRYIAAKTKPYEKGLGLNTYLLAKNGRIIREYPIYAFKAAFSPESDYVSFVGEQIDFIECATGNILWTKTTNDTSNYFDNVFVTYNGEYIITAESRAAGGISQKVIVKIYNKNGVILFTKEMMNQDLRYTGDEDFSIVLSRDGKYLSMNDKNKGLIVYEIEGLR